MGGQHLLGKTTTSTSNSLCILVRTTSFIRCTLVVVPLLLLLLPLLLVVVCEGSSTLEIVQATSSSSSSSSVVLSSATVVRRKQQATATTTTVGGDPHYASAPDTGFFLVRKEEEKMNTFYHPYEKSNNNNNTNENQHHQEETEPVYAILFPALTITLGIMVHYLLSRYIPALPYTAVMFFLGCIMGLSNELRSSHYASDQLSKSIQLWININSEVLLLVFLPGLIFKDAFGLNVHLFCIALGQCCIFAFPLVLAGTIATAYFAKVIFPYGWSWDLCMTFGSILSATDPVAVAALLEQVGAPPRLKVHIDGEALLNDGAAIVFFSIFVERFLVELNIVGFGTEVNWGQGFAQFFRMSLGGVAIGTMFGLGLIVIMNKLSHRFSQEENVVEVVATIAIAYLGYYTAEVVWGTSGVISTVTTGLLVKYWGRPMINNTKLLQDFWTLVEQLLNTLLFTLGGAVWGAVLADGEKNRYFTANGWGYLILLYVFLMILRLVQFACVYPITQHIGLSTNYGETIFQIYGGLRGAVGIALAISLDNEVQKASPGSVYALETRRLFVFVGGIAFMTLMINGVTAGPLLRYLGLANQTETREKVVKAYQARLRIELIDTFVRLLTQPRFHLVNFALVKNHVPMLADLTRDQLWEAVERHKEITPKDVYVAPFLNRILPYLEDDEEESRIYSPDLVNHTNVMLHPPPHHEKTRRRSALRYLTNDPCLSDQDMRLLFISTLRVAYDRQLADGELQDRSFLAVALQQSLDLAEDAVSKGGPLRDWDFVDLLDGPIAMMTDKLELGYIVKTLLRWLRGETMEDDFNSKRIVIERSLAFMAAHRWAASRFWREFDDTELSKPTKVVLLESKRQVQKAAETLLKNNLQDVEIVASHKFCSILLNSWVRFVTRLIDVGLLRLDEAEHEIGLIEHLLEGVESCLSREHYGELEDNEKGDSSNISSLFTADGLFDREYVGLLNEPMDPVIEE